MFHIFVNKLEESKFDEPHGGKPSFDVNLCIKDMQFQLYAEILAS